MTDTEKYYHFPHEFVQELVNYLTLRPYGEVYPFLDKLRLEGINSTKIDEAVQNSKDESGIHPPGTK